MSSEDHSTRDDADVWQEPPGMARAVVAGSLVGVVVALVGVTAAMASLGANFVAALGLGIFVAFWGGVGFGTMVGGVFWANALEEQAHAELLTRDGGHGERAQP